ncbi:MAG: class I SAM-dependent methyltransferase, partial [Gammaproteobacteria bacterium]|nr:class I SAM-dependent methyltransferase [Gammaproteobacteria bacterium]
MTKHDAPPMSVVMSAFEACLESELGQAILAAEREQIARILPQLVGYNCLQLSVQRAATLCDGSRFGHLIKMGYAPSTDSQQQDGVWADYEALPVASDCVDVALLHHVLEFAAQPHQLLREATRTLTAGGHLLIAGFNPFSAWPLWQRYFQWRHLPQGAAAALAPGKRAMRVMHKEPAAQRGAKLAPIRQGRLAEWLSVLNFDVLQQTKFFLRPPLNSTRWLDKLAA